jgi:hypothetical protein
MAPPRTVAGLAVLSSAAVVLVYLAVPLVFKRSVARTVIGALAYHLTKEQPRVHQSRYADNLIPQAARDAFRRAAPI